MKNIELFYLENCPYCKKARAYMDELIKKNPQYRQLNITLIEESKEKSLADSKDYYYVPTFYVDGEKIHEGAATLDDVRRVLDDGLAE